MIEVLQGANIEFSSFDILSDNDVRQGLKTYSNWPTYPQLYVKSQLIGGLDIITEMMEEGPLAEQLGIQQGEEAAAADEPQNLNSRLAGIIGASKCMLFSK